MNPRNNEDLMNRANPAPEWLENPNDIAQILDDQNRPPRIESPELPVNNQVNPGAVLPPLPMVPAELPLPPQPPHQPWRPNFDRNGLFINRPAPNNDDPDRQRRITRQRTAIQQAFSRFFDRSRAYLLENGDPRSSLFTHNIIMLDFMKLSYQRMSNQEYQAPSLQEMRRFTKHILAELCACLLVGADYQNRPYDDLYGLSDLILIALGLPTSDAERDEHRLAAWPRNNQ